MHALQRMTSYMMRKGAKNSWGPFRWKGPITENDDARITENDDEKVGKEVFSLPFSVMRAWRRIWWESVTENDMMRSIWWVYDEYMMRIWWESGQRKVYDEKVGKEVFSLPFSVMRASRRIWWESVTENDMMRSIWWVYDEYMMSKWAKQRKE